MGPNLSLLMVALATASASRLPFGSSPAPSPPHFPASYEMIYTLSMPYVTTVQPQGLSYEVHVWYDQTRSLIRVDALDGADSTIITEEHEYSVVPRINISHCTVYKHGGSGPVAVTSRVAGAAAASMRSLLQGTGLPDLRDWQSLGTTQLAGQTAQIWQLQKRHRNKVCTYTFYVTPEGSPLKLHSVGDDLFAESHFDEYNYAWTFFKAGPVSPEVFQPPPICQQALSAATAASRRSTSTLQLLALLPSSHISTPADAMFGALARAFDVRVDDDTHHQRALERYAAAKSSIDEWNRQAASDRSSRSFQMRLNHFAHLGQEEFEQLLLPNKRRAPLERTPENGFQPMGTFQKRLGRHKLPRHVDWRGTPAELGVKDQAQCGSCWAFGATGAMEAAWFLATGQSRSFSEQQLMDCSWDYGHNIACDGGDYQPAITYLSQVGGAALEADYPYLGLDDFCRAPNTSRAGAFAGYLQVPSRDEEALMEALYLHGPVAVAVDAELASFRFYAEGVYQDRRCSNKPKDLDHAVLLVGYGTTADGVDYWLVRNSWSKLWGEDGYFKVVRGDLDCGIGTDPMVVLVDAQHVVPGLADRLRQAYLGDSSAAASY